MKRQLYIIICCCLTILYSCKSDDNNPNLSQFLGEIESVETFGGSKNDSFRSVIKTFDGGYVTFGFTQSNDGDITDKPNESYDYWLVKYNANNQLVWSKTYGGTADDRGQNVISTTDNGFLITGYSNSNDEDVTVNNGSTDIWIVKLDNSGNITWEKTFGFSGSDQGLNTIQTSDGGYFISGVLDVTASNQLGNDRSSQRHAGGDYWGIKLNANGTKQWRRFFGGSGTDSPYGAVETNDGGFIMSGSSDSSDVDIMNSKGSYDFWAVKIDGSGALVWEKSYGGDEIDEAFAMTKTSDGNFIITGNVRSSNTDVSTNSGSADVWAIKIDTNGAILWEKSYGGSSFETSKAIVSSQNGGFYLSGYSRSSQGNLSNNNGENDIWVFKISESGNLEWQKSIGGSLADLAFGIEELNNNNIVIVGESLSADNDILINKGFTDAVVITLK